MSKPVGARIRWARRRAGISQETFAARVGTSRRHVMRWEGDACQPSAAYVDRIADATGQPADLFRDGDGAAVSSDAADLGAALMGAIEKYVQLALDMRSAA